MERLPGFRDFYPEPLPQANVWSAAARQYVFDRWRQTARRYGFRQYDGPPLEPLELFTLKSGPEIVGQLYNFIDKGDRAVALRPEMTPTLARMVAAHHRNYRKPLKWFAMPQLFRFERHQKGRLKEHFQLNADILGEAGPAADAELVALLIDTLRAFGLTAQDFVVRLSSRSAWTDFFQKRRGAGDPQAGGEKAMQFYQVIDKLERETPEQSANALAQLGLSLEQVHQFIQTAPPTPELAAIVHDLSARGMAEFVKIDYQVIRGLAYYTGVVFEAFDKKGQFRAIAGGGRYDNLIRLISQEKVDMPALGFGMGDVVLLELLKARGLLPALEESIEAFCIIEDESLRQASLELIEHLRTNGYSVDYPLAPAKADKQLKRALELKANFTVKLERSPQGEVMVKLKNLATHQERIVEPPAPTSP